MASASSLRRTRAGFLVVAILAFLVAGGLFMLRPASQPDRRVAEPPPPAALPSGHEHLKKRPSKAIEPVPPAAAADAARSPLSSLSAFASLSTAVIALLGFAITSVMSVRRERRDSALFAIDLEMKRVQLAEMQAKAAQGGKVAAG
jgi:hypothetical protein